jgi:hypothetical protein
MAVTHTPHQRWRHNHDSGEQESRHRNPGLYILGRSAPQHIPDPCGRDEANEQHPRPHQRTRRAPGLPPSPFLGLLPGLLLRLPPSLLLGERLMHSIYQPLGVETERVDLDRVQAHQRSKGGRQVVEARHPRIVHQDRDHPNLPRQRRLNFKPNVILGIIEATLTGLVNDREPLRADQRQQRITRPNRAVIRSTKSSPGSMLSTSLKTSSAGKCSTNSW